MANAVCIYGQLRGDEETWNSIRKYVKENLNADVFVHTWITYENKYYAANLEQYNKIDNKIDNKNEYLIGWNERQLKRQATLSKNIVDFLNIIKPKQILIEEQNIFDNTHYFENTNPSYDAVISYQNSLSQLYSRKQSIKMVNYFEEKYNMKYENIFLLRSDILFNNIFSKIKKNGIYTNNLDTVLYGNRECISMLGNMYDEYALLIKYNNGDLPLWHMEHHMMKYINTCGICKNIVVMPFALSGHGIKRIENIG